MAHQISWVSDIKGEKEMDKKVLLRKSGGKRSLGRLTSVAYPGILFGGGSTNSVEDRGHREQGSGGGSPLVRGSGGSCNFVQGISFHIVKFS